MPVAHLVYSIICARFFGVRSLLVCAVKKPPRTRQLQQEQKDDARIARTSSLAARRLGNMTSIQSSSLNVIVTSDKENKEEGHARKSLPPLLFGKEPQTPAIPNARLIVKKGDELLRSTGQSPSASAAAPMVRRLSSVIRSAKSTSLLNPEGLAGISEKTEKRWP